MTQLNKHDFRAIRLITFSQIYTISLGYVWWSIRPSFQKHKINTNINVLNSTLSEKKKKGTKALYTGAAPFQKV